MEDLAVTAKLLCDKTKHFLVHESCIEIYVPIYLQSSALLAVLLNSVACILVASCAN